MLADRSDYQQAAPHGDLGCHDGYKLLSLERPTVYCSCTLGDLARAMDADPLDDYKAERWERVCRSRGGPHLDRFGGTPSTEAPDAR